MLGAIQNNEFKKAKESYKELLTIKEDFKERIRPK
jgi:hypothetical protein